MFMSFSKSILDRASGFLGGSCPSASQSSIGLESFWVMNTIGLNTI
jgi:hypothetical protein